MTSRNFILTDLGVFSLGEARSFSDSTLGTSSFVYGDFLEAAFASSNLWRDVPGRPVKIQ